MPRRALLLACLLLLISASTAEGAQRTVPRGWLGVTADGPLTAPGAQLDGEWERMAGAGVESVRTAFDWAFAQPYATSADIPPELKPRFVDVGGVPTDFGRLDAVVESAARRGLPVLPVVQRSPAWAAASPSSPASPPRDPQDFARFLAALADRYGPRGSFWAAKPALPRMAIRDWQIWNEPNLSSYWSRQPFARSYVALLKASARTLRRADPRAEVILGGLPNESWLALRRIYRAGGRGSFDAVAIHPYTGTPSRVLKIVELNRREMRRAGDGRAGIWLTELSWPSTLRKPVVPPRFETTERSQATRLAETVKRLAAARRRLRIERVSWYTWLSADQGSSVRFDYAGLRRLRGDRIVSVPALEAFARSARRLQGCVKRPTDARRCR